MPENFPFDLSPRPNRSVALSFVLLLMIIFSFMAALTLATYLFIDKGEKIELPPGLEPALVPYAAVLWLSCGIAALGIWRWQRWGLYLYGIAAILSFTLGLMVRPPPPGSFLQLIGGIFIYLLIGKKRRYFD